MEAARRSMERKSRVEYACNRHRCKMKTCMLYRLNYNIRSRLRSLLRSKGVRKTPLAEFYLGCSTHDFRLYISSKFQDGMTWENYGEWHLDHIVPVSSAESEQDIIDLNHYTNFQPLWKNANMHKSDSTKHLSSEWPRKQ